MSFLEDSKRSFLKISFPILNMTDANLFLIKDKLKAIIQAQCKGGYDNWKQLADERRWKHMNMMLIPQDKVLNAISVLQVISYGALGATSDHKYYAAPTAEEILRELPREIIIGEKKIFIAIDPSTHNYKDFGWRVIYWNRNEENRGWETEISSGEHDTLANAAASMFIYLKNNNLLNHEK